MKTYHGQTDKSFGSHVETLEVIVGKRRAPKDLQAMWTNKRTALRTGEAQQQLDYTCFGV